MESSNKNSERIRLPGPTKRWGAKCFFQKYIVYIYNCNVGMIYAWTFILGASDGFLYRVSIHHPLGFHWDFDWKVLVD